MMACLTILSLAIHTCLASVDFTYSTLYDIKDFKDNDEIFLTKCDHGCVIYASTMGNGFVESPSDYDPYAENLIIRDNTLDQSVTSITDLSRKYEASGQKSPFSFTGPANISVLNVNSPDDTAWPIVLYVLEKNEEVDFDNYRVYDALTMEGVTVDAGTTTVMSAYLFSLSAKANAFPNAVTARLAGPDNVLNDNIDECPVAYSTAPLDTFPGFVFNIAGPIISIAFSGAKLTANIDFIPAFDLNTDGFVTSGGWNGCKKPKSGGIQTFRSGFIQSSDIYTLDSNTDLYNVSIDVIPNLDEQHKVTVHDVIANQAISVSGYAPEHIQFEKTDYVNIVFNGLTGDQGFLLRYSTQALPRTTTTSALTSGSSTSSVTTATEIPTTSSSQVMQNTLLSFFVVFVVARM